MWNSGKSSNGGGYRYRHVAVVVSRLLQWNLVARVTTLVLAATSLTIAGPGPQVTSPVIGTISSSEPITINGSQMLPSVAPSWPLTTKDEITTTAPALLQTTNRDSLTLDGKTRVRVTKATNGFSYVYVRQGGLHFDTKGGTVYVCIGNHLYVPAKAARGSVRLDPSKSVATSLEDGAFIEKGTRSCGPDVTGAFLAGLPTAAGGTGAAGGAIGGASGGGLSTGAIAAIGAGAAAAAAAGAAAAFAGSSSSNPCTTAAGCNFNPPPISPSSP